MAYQYKRHYTSENEFKALCGVANHPMLAQGEKEIQRVSCKNCQRALVAALNTGEDRMVERQGDRLVRVNA